MTPDYILVTAAERLLRAAQTVRSVSEMVDIQESAELAQMAGRLRELASFLGLTAEEEK